eukprot:TRINITY_DN28144_c0_g2_i1.p1 TRINITY_DN28144_c0_g2~~TRINITY_DN28144_c0_g2_i1.p1  ORF type:complete len:171 (-),score=22.91 TRINITY_DN28144_c0_g2_i1:42-554(-)
MGVLTLIVKEALNVPVSDISFQVEITATSNGKDIVLTTERGCNKDNPQWFQVYEIPYVTITDVIQFKLFYYKRMHRIVVGETQLTVKISIRRPEMYLVLSEPSTVSLTGPKSRPTTCSRGLRPTFLVVGIDGRKFPEGWKIPIPSKSDQTKPRTQPTPKTILPDFQTFDS